MRASARPGRGNGTEEPHQPQGRLVHSSGRVGVAAKAVRFQVGNATIGDKPLHHDGAERTIVRRTKPSDIQRTIAKTPTVLETGVECQATCIPLPEPGSQDLVAILPGDGRRLIGRFVHIQMPVILDQIHDNPGPHVDPNSAVTGNACGKPVETVLARSR